MRTQFSENQARTTTLALAVTATAQLMVVLDDTVATIALPTLQNDLALTTAALP